MGHFISTWVLGCGFESGSCFWGVMGSVFFKMYFFGGGGWGGGDFTLILEGRGIFY